MSDKRRKPASGVQLYSLNKLGRLADALEDDGRAYADRCYRLLAEAQERGEWAPKRDRTAEAAA